MTQSIRDAAQAVLDAGDMIGNVGSHARADAMRTAVARLRAALSAPQPTADERVAEHMQTVEDAVSQAAWSGQGPSRDLMAPYIAAVEQSARALLSASQDDAKMLDWLDGKHISMFRSDHGEICLNSEARQILEWAPSLREAIRAAMRKTK